MKVLFLFVSITLSLSLYAQDDKTVTLVVSGQGKTQEEARQVALRSAIEQAFGVFISTKTEILNDKILSDQITSVSAGNIKHYTILDQSEMPNGAWALTLSTIVSISRLTSFVESKGIAIEFKGGLFAANIKQQLLNEQNEINVVSSLVGLLHEPMQVSYDYEISSKDPKSLDAESKNWEIPLEVNVKANKNMEFCADYLIKTLSIISLTSDEVIDYKKLGKTVFSITVKYQGLTQKYYLRKQRSIDCLSSFISNWPFYTRLFEVHSGIDIIYGVGGESLLGFKSEASKKRRVPVSYYDRDKVFVNFLSSKLVSYEGVGWIYDYNYKKSKANNGYSVKNEELFIDFLSSNQTAAKYSWNDQRLLSQIEQMSGYSINPRGIVSSYKFGGYVLSEQNGHGVVVSICDIVDTNWLSAIKTCESLVFNGYSDWYLPSKNELNIMYLNLKSSGIGGFHVVNHSAWYWSSSEIAPDSFNAFYQDFVDGEQEDYIKTSNLLVRPIRKF